MWKTDILTETLKGVEMPQCPCGGDRCVSDPDTHTHREQMCPWSRHTHTGSRCVSDPGTHTQREQMCPWSQHTHTGDRCVPDPGTHTQRTEVSLILAHTHREQMCPWSRHTHTETLKGVEMPRCPCGRGTDVFPARTRRFAVPGGLGITALKGWSWWQGPADT